MLAQRLVALFATFALLASTAVFSAESTPSESAPTGVNAIAPQGGASAHKAAGISGAPAAVADKALTSKQLSAVMDLDARARKERSPRLMREVIAQARKMAHEAISDRATPRARAQALVAIAIALQNGGDSQRGPLSRSPEMEMDRVLLSADRVLIVGAMLANGEPNADIGLAEATDYYAAGSPANQGAPVALRPPSVARGAGSGRPERPASRDDFFANPVF